MSRNALISRCNKMVHAGFVVLLTVIPSSFVQGAVPATYRDDSQIADSNGYTNSNEIGSNYVVSGVEQIRRIEFDVQSTPQAAYRQISSIIERINGILESDTAIKTFRQVSDVPLIKKIATMTTVPDGNNPDARALRIDASLLLANVVDNTTICAVLDVILDKKINDQARFNLLQVIRNVSEYALPENKLWIKAAMNKLKVIENGRSLVEKQGEIIKQVIELNSRASLYKETFRGRDPGKFSACRTLPLIQTLYLFDAAIGDGLAVSLDNMIQNRDEFNVSPAVLSGDNIARQGLSPIKILEIIEKANEHNIFKDNVVVLSSGIVNATTQIDIVAKQISALVRGGPKQIVIVGVANSYNVGGITGAMLNKQLNALAIENNTLFYGDFDVGADSIHPGNYQAIAAGISSLILESSNGL